jgi:adhesin transport system membrane fusion protein
MNKIRIILLIIIIVISTSIIWAKNTSLDIVAVAPGKVVPSNNVKVLQHLEGGIIEKIKVVEGSIVKKGDVLVKFRQIASKSEVGEIKGRLGFIEAGIITYQSLTSKTKPIYPKYLLENYPEIIQNFYNDYKSKLSLLKSEVNLLKAKITADKKESDFAQQKILESKITLKLFNKQVKISSNLKLKNLTSEISHIDLLRNLQILKTKIIEENRKLESLRSNIFIHKKNIELKQVRFNELITNQIKIYLEEKDKYTQRLDKYKDQLGRKSLISPINGMVKSMNFFTEGGVIQPGENILEIVPNDGKFVVKSKLSISDIGFVKINQKVLIKLSGSHSTMFQPYKG